MKWFEEAWDAYLEYQARHIPLADAFDERLDDLEAGILHASPFQRPDGRPSFVHMFELPGGGGQYLIVWQEHDGEPEIAYLGPSLR